MKIYWRNPKGNLPPSHAIFGRSPFLPHLPFELFENAIRIGRLPPPLQAIAVKEKRYAPNKEKWKSLVEQTVENIEKGLFEKVVLARCCALECWEKPDPFAVAAALQQRAENATVFCFAEKDRAWVGASPEYLFHRSQSQVFSEAVAGTRKRGQTEEEDRFLERELMTSGKDLREFNPIHIFLKQSLAPLSLSSPTFSPIRVIKTHNVQHLAQSVSARIKEGVSDEIIRKSLHPTPALCGTPTQAALDWIVSAEPFSRGYYGGTVGWSCPEQSEWVVAIRSCMIEGNMVYLYTGTGIVKGSLPDEEWDELDLKMKLFQGIFA